jgi:hypothetical protein
MAVSGGSGLPSCHNGVLGVSLGGGYSLGFSK